MNANPFSLLLLFLLLLFAQEWVGYPRGKDEIAMDVYKVASLISGR